MEKCIFINYKMNTAAPVGAAINILIKRIDFYISCNIRKRITTDLLRLL